MVKQFIKEIYQTWVAERPTQLAAALAYYGIFSFAPIIFITVSITGVFVTNIDPASQFYQRLETLFGEEISSLVQELVTALSKTHSSSALIISVISFLALLYTASGLFYQLQFSLNKIWHVPTPEKSQTMSFIRQRLLAFIIVIGLGFFAIFAIFANVLLAWFGLLLEKLLGISGNDVLTARLVALLVLFLIIAILYKVLPEAKVSWRDIWLGATISTLLILVAILLAGLFFKYSSFSSALQATGAFTVLLMGFNYIAQIFLLGAVCCRIFSERFGSRHLRE